MREIVIVDTVLDEINNCAYLIFRDADEHFQFQVSKDVGKKVALLLYNAFPIHEKGIYSSFIKLAGRFGCKIDSVVLTPTRKDCDIAKLVISGDKTTEMLINSEDAILIALISGAAIFIDDNNENDIETELISNWCNFFSRVL